MSEKIIEVVAALIWQNGKFFACQRPEHKARGGLWEFVGGKVEQGETKENALIRECREELGVPIAVDDVFMDVTHAYPDITVHLTLFNARFTGEEPKMLEHQALFLLKAQLHRTLLFRDKDGLQASCQLPVIS